jgi:hypothetical protein
MAAKRPRRTAIQDDLQVLTEILREVKAIERKPNSTGLVSVGDLPPVSDLLKSLTPDPVVDAQGSTPEPTLPPAQVYNPFDAVSPVSPVPWDALEDSWLSRGLKRCVKENRPDVMKALLHIMLSRIGVLLFDDAQAVLARVFLPFPGGGAGRPVSSERDSILETWNKIGRPSLTKHTLAWKFYGPKFEMADGPNRKLMRNRCRAAVTRALQAEMAKIASNNDAEDLFPSVD